MSRQPALTYIKKIGKPVFTTFEISVLSGKSLSVVTQSLNYLAKNGLILKVYRGVWADTGNASLSPYAAIPYLFNRRRAYVSFLSALHLHGIIEQIPQVITLASTAHTRTVRTKLGVFSLHKLSPKLFRGFDWYRGGSVFLIAQPEKALVDSLYLSACKKKQFGYFPELHFANSFSFKKAKEFAVSIQNSKVRLYVLKKLEALIPHNYSPNHAPKKTLS
jgi:predicted transcriptional regulator of viral defense system